LRFVDRHPSLAYVDDMLHVPKNLVNVEGVKSALTFMFTDKMNKTRYLALYEETDDHLVVPREFWNSEDLDFQLVDCRPTVYPKADIKSRIVLDAKNPTRTVQRDAVKAILAARGGVLQLACGGGKSAIALHIASLMKVPTLIVVNNTNLIEQWESEINRHLDVPGGIGRMQADKFDWKKPIVLATYQTLAARHEDISEEIRRWFGFIVADEGHHAGAPTFSRMANLFYGKRLALTATPERTDGAHVVVDFHFGKVLFKDLRQELTPTFQFIWSGIKIDDKNPIVKKATTDCKGELHLSRLYGYFGGCLERLSLILDLVKEHERLNRRTLVLSSSVAELVNLFVLHAGITDLYTDIDHPDVMPRCLHPEARNRYQSELKRFEKALVGANTSSTEKERIRDVILPTLTAKLLDDELARKTEKELATKQRRYITEAVKHVGDKSGLLIARVSAKTRMEMLSNRKTVFAIYQYGLEGLDSPSLDTVIACEPMTSKGALQQFTGRILRMKTHKKTPLVQFIEDDIGPIIGMCKKVRGILRTWPADEGGPFTYAMIGHPRSTYAKPGKLRPSGFPPPP
jgi:superfamily II DNA or RNA helicase